MQLAIAAGVTVLATGLFLAPLSAQLDDQAMRRALAIAQTTAAEPQIAEDAAAAPPPLRDGPVQAEAERIRQADRRRVRRGDGHARACAGRTPTPQRDRRARLDRPQRRPWRARRSWRSTAARSAARPAARCRCATPTAGSSARSRSASSTTACAPGCSTRSPGCSRTRAAALAVGALAAYLISRRLQRQTHDLAFSDISALLAEREAMLHGIREGVVALDRARPRSGC